MTSRNRTELLSRWLLLAVLITGPGCASAQTQAPAGPAGTAGDVPYSVGLSAFAIQGFPGLHSSAIAGTANQLVLLAGRTNGLHGFAPSTEAAQAPSFPTAYANDTVYVLDLVNKKLLGQAKVSGLPAPYSNQYQSTNVQYFLSGGFLYVLGGYGPDPATGTLVTLPYVTVVDFNALVTAVTSGTALDAAFAQANMANFQHPALAITGGDAVEQGSSVLLLYGHQFDGVYTPGGGQVYQQYSNSIRVFTMQTSRASSGLQLTVTYQGSYPQVTSGMDPDNPYHRRDLTVRPALDPSGTPRLGVYGGVFKGGRIEGYVNPLYVTPGSNLGLNVTEDTTAVQLLSQYDCATLQIYSQSRSAMYSTFFGGISQYYWDPSCQCLKGNTVTTTSTPSTGALPFIDSISTFRVTSAGSSQFLHQGSTFPPATGAPSCAASTGGTVTSQYLGAETKLVLAAGVPANSGVITLDSLTGKTVLGYLIGGIAAYCPPSGGQTPPACYASGQGTTCASGQIYEVTLDPGTATPTVLLKAPAVSAASAAPGT